MFQKNRLVVLLVVTVVLVTVALIAYGMAHPDAIVPVG